MSIMYEEEDRCQCQHGEARHTALEVPRGQCDATIDLMLPGMAGARAVGRCSCKRFRLQVQPEKLA